MERENVPLTPSRLKPPSNINLPLLNKDLMSASLTKMPEFNNENWITSGDMNAKDVKSLGNKQSEVPWTSHLKPPLGSSKLDHSLAFNVKGDIDKQSHVSRIPLKEITKPKATSTSVAAPKKSTISMPTINPNPSLPSKATNALQKTKVISTTSKLIMNKRKASEAFTNKSDPKQEIIALKNKNHDLESLVLDKEDEIESLSKEICNLNEALSTEKETRSSERTEFQKIYNSKLQSYESIIGTLKEANGTIQKESQLYKDENLRLKEAISSHSSSIIMLESDNKALKLSIEKLENNICQLEEMKTLLTKNLEKANSVIKDLEGRILEGENIRRKLHNEIQELKGNIRVFCRVRPFLHNEKASEGMSSSLAFFKDPMTCTEVIKVIQQLEPASGSTKPIIKEYPFTFDKVFDPNSTQTVIFEEISQLVQSALDGYRVCIFAYGQTGSGKTFTMEGPSGPEGTILVDDSELMGMIPRAVIQIFNSAKELESKGWNYVMEASFLEIYNENLYDLLGSRNNLDAKLDIKHIPNTMKTVVSELNIVKVHDIESVFKLLKKANESRAVGQTQCNEHSSRSHSVFMLKLLGENELTHEKCEGQLNLIDLAGSERLSQSGAQGERLKETQAINKSLSALGDVIMALSNKEAHVPYRNSKLTYLLQNSLGGNSKTLMFVNISPLPENTNESLCSLRFAAKVNACQIGTAKKVILK